MTREYDPLFFYDEGFSNGNGYDHLAGMSNNAIDAYDRGVKPLSRIELKNLKNAGWEHTKSLAMFLAAEKFWRSCEWHHSGGQWFNRVDFYDPSLLVEKWSSLTDSERYTWMTRFKESKSKDSRSDGEKVAGKYTMWGGTRRYRRKIGTQAFTGVKVGDWIHLDGGGRKKANGGHITWGPVK
jgi:hypothetical protein